VTRDILTVMWKEWKEILALGGASRGRSQFLIFLGMFGVLFPLQIGVESVTSPIAAVLWGFIPPLVVSTLIADAFAGERERHTLETLLSSRLSDSSILFGKIAASVAYGWGLAMASLIVGLITVNVASGDAGFLFFSSTTLTGTLLLSLLSALLASAGGVLVSLRAKTVRQAQQTLALAMVAMAVAPLFIALAVPGNLKESLSAWADRAGTFELMLAGLAVLVVIDVVLIVAAKERFQRSKLTVG
jgi:ABC-2 type transport system permease protein